MALEKLKILVESSTGSFRPTITAQFNPEQITLERKVNWRETPTAEADVPRSQFTHGEPSKFDIVLRFDSYSEGRDVRAQTGKVLALMTVEDHGDLHRPPICRLSWGKLGVFFQGVLAKVKQEFTVFLADGTPVRATLTCTFKEWRSAEEDRRRKNASSADVAKTYVVRLGDTLDAIAAAQYRDPTLWRPIAAANKIVNPRLLVPGTVLTIPAITGTTSP